MELHLINGFLGSGKTTAIIAATKNLVQQGKTVGIVTNDKGQFQVDTAFFQSNQVPTRQVTGGCFRCSFSEFEERVAQLQASSAPDVIFAESVGSCVDLVNTIFSPLQKNALLNIEKTTYSVFSDLRLFRRWIYKEPLPFSEQVLYLFSKQIEESSLLVLNKSDLLAPDLKQEVLTLAMEQFPEKVILLQNSLDPMGTLAWLDVLNRTKSVNSRPGFDVDYPVYKGGEKEMAWLDYEFFLEADSGDRIRQALIDGIRFLLEAVQDENIMVGHVKFFFSDRGKGTKLSFTTADFLSKPVSPIGPAQIPEIFENSLLVMLNARVAENAETFAKIVDNVIQKVNASAQVRIQIEPGDSYNPEMSMNRPK